jgi:hypothetical protein
MYGTLKLPCMPPCVPNYQHHKGSTTTIVDVYQRSARLCDYSNGKDRGEVSMAVDSSLLRTWGCRTRVLGRSGWFGPGLSRPRLTQARHYHCDP